MHGNTKYKFHQLSEIGDIITERPRNLYSLKAALRAFNKKRKDDGLPELEIQYHEFGGKRVDLELTGFTK